jgi:hypothetical protein
MCQTLEHHSRTLEWRTQRVLLYFTLGANFIPKSFICQGEWKKLTPVHFSGPFLTSPIGVNFAPGAKLSPRGEFCVLGVKLPLGVKLSVCPSILLNSIECSPLGVNKGDKFFLLGPSSPLGASGEVKNSPQNHSSSAGVYVPMYVSQNMRFQLPVFIACFLWLWCCQASNKLCPDFALTLVLFFVVYVMARYC